MFDCYVLAFTVDTSKIICHIFGSLVSNLGTWEMTGSTPILITSTSDLCKFRLSAAGGVRLVIATHIAEIPLGSPLDLRNNISM